MVALTARTAALEELKQQEDLATDTALRFENDLENIKRKLAIRQNADLVRYALKHGYAH